MSTVVQRQYQKWEKYNYKTEVNNVLSQANADACTYIGSVFLALFIGFVLSIIIQVAFISNLIADTNWLMFGIVELTAIVISLVVIYYLQKKAQKMIENDSDNSVLRGFLGFDPDLIEMREGVGKPTESTVDSSGSPQV